MDNKAKDRILKFLRELDKEGRTVLRPLTNEDNTGIEDALSNPRGVTFGPVLRESLDCPLDPDVPFGISTCGIEAEGDSAKAHIRGLARDQWDKGDRELAKKMLEGLRADGHVMVPKELSVTLTRRG